VRTDLKSDSLLNNHLIAVKVPMNTIEVRPFHELDYEFSR